MERIKTAFIGFGYRGKQLFRLAGEIPFYNIVGVADPYSDFQGVEGVACYGDGEDSYLAMLDEQKPELVFITTPWILHVSHAMECVRRHCHVALEIKGGLYADEYQPLVDLSHQNHCMVYPLENTLFLREIQSVNRMVAEGLLGEIVYMRGGYRHDLRSLLLDDNGKLGRRSGESVWRSGYYLSRNCDMYPTHGFAPLCMIGGIGKADRLTCLTSFASKAVGLRHKMKELSGSDANIPHIATGDIITTQIETQQGVLISLVHDTTLPRPRSLDFEVQGTKGVWKGNERLIYIEGVSAEERWEDDAFYVDKYESDYWKRWGQKAIKCDSHHQGMDYIMLKALEVDQKGEIPYPASLQDLALWTSVTILSDISIKENRKVDL